MNATVPHLDSFTIFSLAESTEIVNTSEHTQICQVDFFHWQELQADSARPICL